jgi:hypothetical protein
VSDNTAATNATKARPKSSRAWWRPIVDGIDSVVTPPANALVRSNAFADAVSTLTRLEVRLRRRAERQSTWLLHLYNLPTAGDVRRMRAQLAALQAQLRDVSERVEELQHESDRDGRRDVKPATAKRRARS